MRHGPGGVRRRDRRRQRRRLGAAHDSGGGGTSNPGIASVIGGVAATSPRTLRASVPRLTWSRGGDDAGCDLLAEGVAADDGVDVVVAGGRRDRHLHRRPRRRRRPGGRGHRHGRDRGARRGRTRRSRPGGGGDLVVVDGNLCRRRWRRRRQRPTTPVVLDPVALPRRDLARPVFGRAPVAHGGRRAGRLAEVAGLGDDEATGRRSPTCTTAGSTRLGAPRRRRVVDVRPRRAAPARRPPRSSTSPAPVTRCSPRGWRRGCRRSTPSRRPAPATRPRRSRSRAPTPSARPRSP